MGFGRTVIEVFFQLLPSDLTRTQMDGLLRAIFIENGFPCQRWFYNCPWRKFHSLIITTLYLVLLVLHPVTHLFLTKSIINTYKLTHSNTSFDNRDVIMMMELVWFRWSAFCKMFFITIQKDFYAIPEMSVSILQSWRRYTSPQKERHRFLHW